MDHKKKMFLIGTGGAVLLLILLVVGIVLLVSSCKSTPTPDATTAPPQAPKATDPAPSAPPKTEETSGPSLGIDVARYQGTIDWDAVAATGIDFAMIRVGYRSSDNGKIVADSNARYNMQEASRCGIHIGVYFFSTAITEEEALEEAQWVADFIAQYPITYPVAYNCEGFNEFESRQRRLTAEVRTDLALVFLEAIESRGYTGMFYGSQNDLEQQWETERIQSTYRIWLAQYPEQPYPQTQEAAYDGTHHMWQYTQSGTLDGIAVPVDRNVAWFGYEKTALPKDPTPPEPAQPDPEATMDFAPVNDQVTAKIKTNLRDIPGQDDDSTVLYTLPNGEWITRTGISQNGWSRLERGGVTYYAVTSYLTTDPNYTPQPPQADDGDGIDTVFTPVNDRVTAKDVVNLRSIPSVTREDSLVVAQLHKGEIITRTGINTDVGWSRVEYNGQVLYCISSYLEVVEE